MANADIPAHLQTATFGKDGYTVQEIISGRRRGKFYSFYPTPTERDQIYDFCRKHALHARSMPTPARLFEMLHAIGYFSDHQPLDAHLAHRLLDYICHTSTQHALAPQGNTVVAQDAWQGTKADLKEALLAYSGEGIQHADESQYGQGRHHQVSVENSANMEQSRQPRRMSWFGAASPASPSSTDATPPASSTGMAATPSVSFTGMAGTPSASSASMPPTRDCLSPPALVRKAAPNFTPHQKALLTTLGLKLPADVTYAELYTELERAAQRVRHTIAVRDGEVEKLREQYVKAKKIPSERR